MHFNAPSHVRHKLMSAPLSPELTASRGAKTLPVRKGDTVRIQRGDNKGFEGKISRIDLKEYRIYIEGLTREKTDGTNIFLPVHPSKVQIRNLNLDDSWRKDILKRKTEAQKPEKEEKPKAAKKAVKAPAKKQAEEEKEATETVEEEAAPKTAKEEASEPKKAPAKKAAAKTTTAKEEASEEEAAPKKAAKKAPSAKETAAKEAAPQPRAKKKTSEGGR